MGIEGSISSGSALFVTLKILPKYFIKTNANAILCKLLHVNSETQMSCCLRWHIISGCSFYEGKINFKVHVDVLFYLEKKRLSTLNIYLPGLKTMSILLCCMLTTKVQIRLPIPAV